MADTERDPERDPNINSEMDSGKDPEKELTKKKKECLRRSGLLLAQRDYTCSRLREKLLSAGYSEDVVGSTIESLLEARYLDDERYARSYIQAHWEDRSRLRIRMDLEKRGVPSQIADRVLREEGEERGSQAEIRQVRRLMKKRGYDPHTATWEEKGKLQAFLYRKGYSASSVRAAMRTESLDSVGFSV